MSASAKASEKPVDEPDLSAMHAAANLYPGMTLGCLKTFVHAYRDGGRSTMVELAKSLDVVYTTYARHTDTLGVTGKRKDQAVYGLFEKVEHPRNRRAIAIVPTERGHDLARAMGLRWRPAAPDLHPESRAVRIVTPGTGRGRS